MDKWKKVDKRLHTVICHNNSHSEPLLPKQNKDKSLSLTFSRPSRSMCEQTYLFRAEKEQGI